MISRRNFIVSSLAGLATLLLFKSASGADVIKKTGTVAVKQNASGSRLVIKLARMEKTVEGNRLKVKIVR